MNNLYKTVLLLGLSVSAGAEIITDGSLGVASTLRGPDFQITADLGQQRGGNLFHSFRRFNIASKERATFTGPADITTIISRVTGGGTSTIDGLLRSRIKNANLFLLNPDGVVFGPNARLDISGSVHVSSGDYLALDDLTRFMATPQAGEILTTAAPTAFGFLGESGGAIRIRGSDLDLADGETLTLAANGITLDKAAVTADQGAMQLFSVATAGEVSVNTGDTAAIDGYGAIAMDNSTLELKGDGGNGVLLQGEDIVLHDSEITTWTEGRLHSEALTLRASGSLGVTDSTIATYTTNSGHSGAIHLSVARDLTIANSTVATVVASKGTGDAGAIHIDADNLHLSNRGEIQSYADSNTSGHAGAISLDVGKLLIDGNGNGSNSFPPSVGAGIVSYTHSTGNASAINIAADEVEVFHGGGVVTDTFAGGNAGSIQITAERLLIDGRGDNSGFSTRTYATGDAGDITVAVKQYEVTGGGGMTTDTHGSGMGGLIKVTAEQMRISAAEGVLGGISSRALSTATGDAGGIAIEAGDIEIVQGGEIATNTFGSGDAGFITVHTDRLLIDSMGTTPSRTTGFTDIRSGTGAGTTGNGGRIEIYAGEVAIRGHGAIEISTGGRGNAGSVKIEADQFAMSDGSVLSSTLNGSAGDAGAIELVAGSVTLADGALIASGSLGSGAAGRVTLQVADDVSLEESFISTATIDGFDPKQPASIDITAQNLLLDQGSSITTSAVGSANAGDIDLRIKDSLRLLDRAFLSTSADNGNSGQMTISGNTIHLHQGAEISSDTLGRGNAGRIDIATSFLSLDGDRITSADTGIFSNAEVGSSGDAGRILIRASDAELLSGATIATNTHGTGRAGRISVIGDRLLVDAMGSDMDTGIFSSAIDKATGTAGAIDLTAGSIILNHGLIASQSSGKGAAGNVALQATGDVSLRQSSITTETIGGFDPEQPAFIDIVAQNLLLDQDSSITTSATGKANAGDIQLDIGDKVQLFNRSLLNTSSVDGNGGVIAIQADNTQLRYGAEISSNTRGRGNAGQIDLATTVLSVIGDGNTSLSNGIFSNAEVGSSGDAGRILIRAGDAELLSGATIATNTHGKGRAGRITMITDQLLLDSMGLAIDTGIFSGADAGSTGDAGSIIINGGIATVRGAGLIDTSTSAGGNAGSITLELEQLLIDGDGLGGGVFSNTRATGDAGNLDIQVATLTVEDSGLIDTSTTAQGNAGGIHIGADEVTLERATILSRSSGDGRAGNITIDTAAAINLTQSSITTETLDGFDPEQPAFIRLTGKNLSLQQGSAISTSAAGENANAGSIDLLIDDSVQLAGDSYLSTESAGGGGGQITLLTRELLHLRDSAITTNVARGEGNGGNIFVDPVFILLDNSRITANAFAGDGGNITLIADYIIQSMASRVLASSALGIDGNIDIQALDVEVDTGEDKLAANFLSAENWVQQACSQHAADGISSFIIQRPAPRPTPYDSWAYSPPDF